MCVSLSILLEVTPPFILLIPGFLPLFFFAQTRVTGPLTRSKRAPVICIFVSLLGPLAAISAGLALSVLVIEQYQHYFRIAQIITQSFVELAYRIPVLYVIRPRSFLALASQIRLSERRVYGYGNFYAIVIFAAFVLTVVHTSLLRQPYPVIAILGVNALACIYPVPLLLYLAISTKTPRLRRVWVFLIVIQLLSAIATGFRFPRHQIYTLGDAAFTTLWGGSLITLFYTFCSVPIPQPSSERLRLSPVQLSPSTPTRSVRYETSIARPGSGSGLIASEDFTALRDPFASPTSVSPGPSPKKGRSLHSPFTPPATPRIPHSPVPPAPLRRAHTVSSPPQSKHVRPVRRPPPPSHGLKKKTSSQSIRPLAADTTNEKERREHPSREDSFFLNDEALLSQVLLHSLTMEAGPTTSLPEAPSDMGHSMYSSAPPSDSQHGCLPPRRSSIFQRPAMSEIASSNPLILHNTVGNFVQKKPSANTMKATDLNGSTTRTLRSKNSEFARRHISDSSAGDHSILEGYSYTSFTRAGNFDEGRIGKTIPEVHDPPPTRDGDEIKAENAAITTDQQGQAQDKAWWTTK
ncbi:hypothetical protein M422DRAFT_257183 [Sphaerobolus stellatus SS14]|uniref:Uncharacterized protein n=1 Tax=Sphaerobolus stellatus (strain SS14) TaxID=990650 RepID=A0A0C9VPT3_SPHS4|nr:hypothetical protein M422DRAFT_257183 [Sphaerobolus stellatus SS14]